MLMDLPILREKQQNAMFTQSKCDNQNAEKRLATMPKRNADFRVKSKGLCIFIMSLNLMDLALDKKK